MITKWPFGDHMTTTNVHMATTKVHSATTKVHMATKPRPRSYHKEVSNPPICRSHRVDIQVQNHLDLFVLFAHMVTTKGPQGDHKVVSLIPICHSLRNDIQVQNHLDTFVLFAHMATTWRPQRGVPYTHQSLPKGWRWGAKPLGHICPIFLDQVMIN